MPVSLDELLEDYATESGQAFDVTWISFMC